MDEQRAPDKCGKEAYKKWKQGQMTEQQYGDAVQAYRDGVRKANAYLELNLERDVKGNKKNFLRYINSKRKIRENVGPLLTGARDLVTKDMQEAEEEYLPCLSQTHI